MQKKGFFTIPLIFLVLLQSLQAQDTFLRIYPNPEDEGIHSIVVTSDNQMIICGYTYNSETEELIGTITKLNQFGDIIISIQTNSVSSYSMMTSSPNEVDIVNIVGYKDTTVNNKLYNSMIFQKMNIELEILNTWSFAISDSCKNFSQSFVIAEDSLVFITSNNDRNSPGFFFNPALFKLNLNSSQVVSYEYPNGYLDFLSNIINIENQDRIKVNYFTSIPTQIATFDYELNLVSLNEIVNDFQSYHRISNFDDTTYLFSASRYSSNGRELGIAKYNLNDSLLKQTIFPGNADSMTYPGGGRNMLVSTENIWVVGWYNVIPQYVPCSPEPTWIVLNKLNHNLDLQEQIFYGGNGVYIPFDITETNNESIVIVGHYYNPDITRYNCQFDPFVLKVNSEGLIVNTQNNELPLAQEAIVFPNPGSEYLQVKLAVQHKTATLQLFDLNGRLIHTEEITADMQRVNTTTLPAGIYPYRISTKDRVIGSGKWVKE